MSEDPKVEKKEIPEDMAKAIASQLTKSTSGESIVMDKVTEIASYIASIRQPERYNPNIPFAVVPEFMQLLDVEAHMPHPARIKKSPVFVDCESFCRYYNAYKGGHDPKIFASKSDSGLVIKAVFDMDIEGRDILKEDGEIEKRVMPLAQWNSHQAIFAVTFDEDYADLRKASGQWMPQREFALFIEKNIHLFVDPVGADMLELAQELRGVRKASWRAGKRLANNTTSIQYAEDEIEATGGSIEIPQYLTFKSPIFEGTDPVDYKAAFSYDIGEDRGVKFSLRLMTKLEERQAENDIKMEVSMATGEVIYNLAHFGGLTRT